jgi:L-lactate utilization protein LutC
MNPSQNISPPMLDQAIIRQFDAHTPDLIARWIERAQACSIKVHPTPDNLAALQTALDQCLAPHAIRRTLLNARSWDDALAAHLAAREIEAIRWGSPDCRNEAFACEAAITDCRAGLADSGGILVWSDETFGRSSTLVIPIHIVFLRTSQILPDLVDGLQLAYSRNPRPSNIVIINGPSKTADIEMNLITGVHGPKFLHVILICDAGFQPAKTQ